MDTIFGLYEGLQKHLKLKSDTPVVVVLNGIAFKLRSIKYNRKERRVEINIGQPL